MNIKKLIKVLLSKMGFEVKRIKDYVRYNDDQFFVTILKEIQSKTLLDVDRLYLLYQFGKYASLLKEGEVAECGVYRGGSGKLLARVFNKYASHKKIFLFDTFEGMPEVDSFRDLHKKGDFNDVSFEDVEKFFSDCNNVYIFKGLFSEKFSNVKNYKFSLVHIDCDIYNSGKECCEFFYPRMVKGGVIIFDDYGFSSCPGLKIAVDEFFYDKFEKVIVLPTKQGLVIKV